MLLLETLVEDISTQPKEQEVIVSYYGGYVSATLIKSCLLVLSQSVSDTKVDCLLNLL
jgi:hypothetical protein